MSKGSIVNFFNEIILRANFKDSQQKHHFPPSSVVCRIILSICPQTQCISFVWFVDCWEGKFIFQGCQFKFSKISQGQQKYRTHLTLGNIVFPHILHEVPSFILKLIFLFPVFSSGIDDAGVKPERDEMMNSLLLNLRENSIQLKDPKIYIKSESRTCSETRIKQEKALSVHQDQVLVPPATALSLSLRPSFQLTCFFYPFDVIIPNKYFFSFISWKRTLTSCFSW